MLRRGFLQLPAVAWLASLGRRVARALPSPDPRRWRWVGGPNSDADTVKEAIDQLGQGGGTIYVWPMDGDGWSGAWIKRE